MEKELNEMANYIFQKKWQKTLDPQKGVSFKDPKKIEIESPSKLGGKTPGKSPRGSPLGGSNSKCKTFRQVTEG